MKVEARKTVRTSALSVSADTISSAPQQAYVFVIYSFAANVAFLVALNVPSQFQI